MFLRNNRIGWFRTIRSSFSSTLIVGKCSEKLDCSGALEVFVSEVKQLFHIAAIYIGFAFRGALRQLKQHEPRMSFNTAQVAVQHVFTCKLSHRVV